MSSGARIPCRLPLAMAWLALLATQANAQGIDGEWCRMERSFKIQGPSILTYGGSQVTGENEQNAFRYFAPANEPESGTEIFMILRSEQTLYLLRRPQGQKDFHGREAWQRCKVTS